MRIRPTLILIVSITLVFVSCQKMDEKELEYSYFYKNTAYLMEKLDKRLQPIMHSYDNDLCSIIFSDGSTFHFPHSIYPILAISKENCWTINGLTTSIPVMFNEEGDIQIPSLSINNSGIWLINEFPTSLSAVSFLSLVQTVNLSEQYLLGLIYQPKTIYLILSDKSVYRLAEVNDNYYIVPTYYLNHLVEKELMAEKSISEADNDYSSFIFFTDSHWYNNYQHSPAIIHHITNYTGINKVFFGGDVIYRHETDPLRALQEGFEFQKRFSFLGPNFYCVYGNHDNNSDGQTNAISKHLTEEQVVSYLQSQMVSVDKKDGYNFYFDEIQSKTRYIGLDTGRFFYSKFRSTSVNTAYFLIEALKEVPADWHIIIFSHCFMSTTKVDKNTECVFDTFNYFPLTILDAYNQRQYGFYTHNKQTAYYDFSNCTGHVELCVCGHIHIEGILFTEGGIPVISVPTDSKNIVGQDAIKKGSISEQSVSILVLDYSSRIINLYAIGRGTDRVVPLP